jgi:hypothetical protein
LPAQDALEQEAVMRAAGFAVKAAIALPVWVKEISSKKWHWNFIIFLAKAVHGVFVRFFFSAFELPSLRKTQNAIKQKIEEAVTMGFWGDFLCKKFSTCAFRPALCAGLALINKKR